VVEVAGSEPGAKIQQIGQSVTYGVTMLREAPNTEAARAFLQYLMDPEGGLKILKDQGQRLLSPCRVPTQEMKTELPEALQLLVEVK
jgi:molybdate/tungstate transport system substrate-binding protein